jgi:hypothetical protein
MRTLDPAVIEAAKRFLGVLVDHGGTARPQQIPLPAGADPYRVEDRARSACRQRGYACYHRRKAKTPAHWAITPLGRRVAAKEIPW